MHPLKSAFLGIGLVLAGLMSQQGEQPLESQYIHALAPVMFPLKNDGTDLQREAFRTSDLLVVYGSSELEFLNPYHASTVFAAYPSGFTIFPVDVA